MYRIRYLCLISMGKFEGLLQNYKRKRKKSKVIDGSRLSRTVLPVSRVPNGRHRSFIKPTSDEVL